MLSVIHVIGVHHRVRENIDKESLLWDVMYLVMYKTSGPVVNGELTCNTGRDHNRRSSTRFITPVPHR
ncbi:hypothetical protein J6590_096676 [Homalodisca vitripennis]|nr:hypothetical protein J6590_096676 [Homalodisca vitripennis]